MAQAREVAISAFRCHVGNNICTFKEKRLTARPVLRGREKYASKPLGTLEATSKSSAPHSSVFIAVAVGSSGDHMTEWVRSSVVLSKYVPVAPNCGVVPWATAQLHGVTVQ